MRQRPVHIYACMVCFQQIGRDEKTTPAPEDEQTTPVPLILEPAGEICTHWTTYVQEKCGFTKKICDLDGNTQKHSHKMSIIFNKCMCLF